MRSTKHKWKRCPQSGQTQMLSWLPDRAGYPGAVVCNSCSYGVQIRKGSSFPATSRSGFEGVAGVVRTHYLTAPASWARGDSQMKYA